MGLRITESSAAMNAYRSLAVTDGQLARSREKVPSGFRSNEAAEDAAAGLSVAEGLRARIEGLKVAVRKAQYGISVVQIAVGAMDEVHSILGRMRDLAVQAVSSGSEGTNARTAAQTELTRLNAELDRIGTASVVGNRASSAQANTLIQTFQIGPDHGETLAVSFNGISSSILGTSSLDLVDRASSAVTALDAAIRTVSTNRANLAAVQDRFEHTISNLSVAAENLSAFESRIRDTNTVQEMVSFHRRQAVTAMLAEADQSPQQVLQLLRGV
jgi:flagellin